MPSGGRYVNSLGHAKQTIISQLASSINKRLLSFQLAHRRSGDRLSQGRASNLGMVHGLLLQGKGKGSGYKENGEKERPRNDELDGIRLKLTGGSWCGGPRAEAIRRSLGG